MIGGLVSIGLGIRKAGAGALELAQRLGWKRGAVLVLLLVVIGLGIRGNVHKASAERLAIELEESEADLELERVARAREITAHHTTKANYRAAQIEAERLELERIAAAEKRQKGITNEISRDYARRLGDLRARFERLQNEPARARGAAIGAAGGVAMPGAPDPAGGAHETAGGGFPRADRGLELEPSERLIAAELALQLESLIDWIEAQAKAAAHE